jgi:hypothetical protein
MRAGRVCFCREALKLRLEADKEFLKESSGIRVLRAAISSLLDWIMRSNIIVV